MRKAIRARGLRDDTTCLVAVSAALSARPQQQQQQSGAEEAAGALSDPTLSDVRPGETSFAGSGLGSDDSRNSSSINGNSMSSSKPQSRMRSLLRSPIKGLGGTKSYEASVKGGMLFAGLSDLSTDDTDRAMSATTSMSSTESMQGASGLASGLASGAWRRAYYPESRGSNSRGSSAHASPGNSAHGGQSLDSSNHTVPLDEEIPLFAYFHGEAPLCISPSASTEDLRALSMLNGSHATTIAFGEFGETASQEAPKVTLGVAL